MRNAFKKIVKELFNLFVVVFLLTGIISCASSAGSSETGKTSNFDTKQLVGTWFWDYSFNQYKFANEQLTLNKDGTFELFHIQPEWNEWDMGDWSVIDDEKYGPSLVLHITHGKNKLEDEWEPINVRIHFAIYKVTGDELFTGRYKRDFSQMGFGIQHYENPVANNFFRVKPGDVNKLEGTWVFNNRSMPEAEQEESWTISADGKIISHVKFAGGKTVNLNGTYDVEKNSILHISFEKVNGRTLPEPEEYWYEYNNVGENLINVNCLRYVADGKDVTLNKKEVNFFYRDLSLAKYTYNVNNGTQSVTFFDNYPFSMEYETLGLDKIYLMDGVPDNFSNHVLLGWYDNPEFTGEPVKKVAASDSSAKHKFWAKWTIRCSRSEWNNSDGSLDHNHGFDLPMVIAIPDFKIPSVGDTVKVLFYAKTNKDIDGWGGVNFVDYSNEGKEFTNAGWKPFKTNNKTILEVYELKINDNLKTSDINKIGFRFGYDKNALDESCIFDEYRFEIIDENSSIKTFEHTLNYGGFEFKKSSVSGYPFYLPSKISDFENVHWTLYNNTEISGWYDNPEFKGNPIDLVLAEQNTKTRTFYGKPKFKFYPSEKQDNGNFYSNFQVLVKSVIPNVKINPKAGDVVKVALSATLSKDFSGNMGLDLANNRTGFDFLGNDWHNVHSENGKLETCFEIKLEKDADFKNIDEPQFVLAYNPYAEGEVLYLSDVKFEFVDRDPYIKPYASSKHMKVEPCAEGFKFTLTKAPEDTNQWQWNMQVRSYNENNIEIDASVDTEELDKNGKISFIWPFVEKGKEYRFTLSGNDAKGHYLTETLKVEAQNGKGELNYKAIDPIEIFLESNSKEANLCAKNLTVQKIMELVDAYKADLSYVNFGCPIISGKNDWSDTNWLFHQYIKIFPEVNENQTFYMDLMKNGKANLLGDYNIYWGDAQKINNALSEKPTFWTQLSIGFNIKQNTGVGFSLITKASDNTPYVPVKF